MNDKNYFDDFRKSYSIKDKYYDLGSYMFGDLLRYKADKSEAKREETPEERDARFLREKAAAREVKIDEILKK